MAEPGGPRAALRAGAAILRGQPAPAGQGEGNRTAARTGGRASRHAACRRRQRCLGPSDRTRGRAARRQTGRSLSDDRAWNDYGASLPRHPDATRLTEKLTAADLSASRRGPSAIRQAFLSPSPPIRPPPCRGKGGAVMTRGFPCLLALLKTPQRVSAASPSLAHKPHERRGGPTDRRGCISVA